MADFSFKATARIPFRPLSYDNRDLAEPKELIVDYVTNELYICNMDGEIINITASVNSVIAAFKEQITSDPNIVTDVNITLPDGTTTTIDVGLAAVITNNTELMDKLGYSKNDAGEVTLSIPAASITESSERQFVTAAEKAAWNSAGAAVQMDIVISGTASDWVATDGGKPYIQTIANSYILAIHNPIVDIKLSDNYATSQEELKEYAKLFKIVTRDGYLDVYSEAPTTKDITITAVILSNVGTVTDDTEEDPIPEEPAPSEGEEGGDKPTDNIVS